VGMCVCVCVFSSSVLFFSSATLPQEGDIVKILSSDDIWLRGENQRSGESGFFPETYVEMMDRPPSGSVYVCVCVCVCVIVYVVDCV
jgi:SH3 domain